MITGRYEPMRNLRLLLIPVAAAIAVSAVPTFAQTISSIEINQSIGKLFDGTPNTNFVAGKATVVRAFMTADVMVDPSTTSALILRNGQNVATIPPKNYALPTRVVDFLCPSLDACGRWAAGSYEFQVTVNGSPLKSTAGTKYDFQVRQTLRILARPVKAIFSGAVVRVPNDNWKTNWTFTRASYPIADDAITWDIRDELDATNLPNLPIDMDTDTGRTNLWQALKNLQPDSCTVNPRGTGCYDLIVGFIGQNPKSETGGRLAGYTLTGPGDLSATVVTVATDPDANATVAHEIAHTRQLGDTYSAGAINCTLNPAPNGVTGTDYNNPGQQTTCTAGRLPASNIDRPGNNIDGTLVPETVNPYDVIGTGPLPNKGDFMASGNGSPSTSFWITPDSYTRLFNQLAPLPVQAARTKTRAAAAPVRVVEFSGLVSAAGAVTLQPWQSFFTEDTIPANVGKYSIRALDANGATLASQGFDVSFFVLTRPPTSVSTAPFNGVITFPDNTVKFQILKGASVIKEAPVSKQDPVVTQVTPVQTGQTIAAQYTIFWSGTDGDGDALSYTVRYTPDVTAANPTWEVIGDNLRATSYTYDFSGLPGGQHAAILVTASDGVRTGSGQSAPFVVPFKSPQVFIDNQANENFELDDEIELSGAAVDLQDGLIPDARLVWSSNISGKLGVGGDLFVTLPAGVHTITLTATSSAGVSSSSSVAIRVGSRATAFEEVPATHPVVATAVFESLVASATLPAGALTKPAAVTIEVTAAPANSTPPPGMAFVGRNVNLTIEQESQPDVFTPVTSIPQGVTITLGYNATVDPVTVRLFRWNQTTNSWIDAATECQPASVYNRSIGQIVVKVCMTGSFALAAPASLSIANYQLVSKQGAAGTQSALTYRADLINPGNALGLVSATVSSLDPFSVRVQPGQDVLTFARVPAGGQVTSSNTFTILTNGSVPFDFSKLKWTFQTAQAAPVANAGPNQSVKAGSTVTLNGNGSTNPGGIGTLGYSWVFTSRPPGTTSRLLNSTTSTPQFVADIPGTFVVTLTVSNGAVSDSASVTITVTP